MEDRSKGAMAKRPRPIRDRIIDAALNLAAERPWRTVTLADIAAAARTDLAALQENFASRTAIVTAVMSRADAAVLGGTDAAAASEPLHDRLLDALLRRLDELRPHKQAVRSILYGMPADPLGALCAAPRFLASMGWMLESAGIGSTGPAGRLRVNGLAAIYLGALRVWLADDTPDQGRTMAYLDRRLRQAGRVAGMLPGGRHGASPEAPAEGAG